jgi:sensor histidine kinase YesM
MIAGVTMNKTTATDMASPESGVECAHIEHPLELIPYFRRFESSLWRDLLYTLIWSSCFAVLFTIVALVINPKWDFVEALWTNLVLANCIGFLIHGGFELGKRAFGGWILRQSYAVRTIYYSGISIVSVFAGYWLGLRLLNLSDAQEWVFSRRGAMSILLLSLLITAMLAVMYRLRERQALAEAAVVRERARVEAAEHQIHLAQLKMLEAQIEPHFLYNTLANVISLVDSEPAAAKRMVERLIDYLRRAAAASSNGASTLGTQVELLRAYLDLIVLRMGSRLSYRVDVPGDLAALTLPPMLLQPLVENAIKHGLEPKVAGGQVTVAARRDDGLLRLIIADDGQGFPVTGTESARGLGLANLRGRLASLYGDRAQMVIEDSHPGTSVTLSLPIDAKR